jgi:hypothetical protein
MKSKVFYLPAACLKPDKYRIEAGNNGAETEWERSGWLQKRRVKAIFRHQADPLCTIPPLVNGKQ